jgi:hypothetical protein
LIEVDITLLFTIALLIFTGISVFFTVRFGLIILRMEDAIENCLDILDEKCESIDKILEIPLFSDSPEIRQVHTDLRRSRDAILQIASVLTKETLELETEDSAPKEKNNT